jgi:hypothetical protein
MKSGGFDIVIGNPPYVRQEMISDMKPYLKNNFNCFASTADYYVYFYEKGIELLRPEGMLSYISSNKFIRSNYGMNLRKHLQQYQIKKIIDFGELHVFEDASTFPVIVILKKAAEENSFIFCQIQHLNFTYLNDVIEKEAVNLPASSLSGSSWSLSEHNETEMMNKMREIGTSLEKYVGGQIKFGIKTGCNEAFIIEKNKRNEIIADNPKSEEIIKPFLDGNDVRKYYDDFKDNYLILFSKGWTKAHCGKNADEINGWKYIEHHYPKIAEHLIKYQEKAEKRQDKGDFWWELRACDYYEDFEKPKILYPDIALEPRFTIDFEGYYPNATLFEIQKDDKFLLTLLNSNLIWFYLARNCPVIGDIKKRGRLRLKTVYLKTLPISITTYEKQKPFIEKADIMLSKSKELQELKHDFLRFLQSELKLEKISKKLENWYELNWDDFKAESAKGKVKIQDLSLKDRKEWQAYFAEQKVKAADIRAVIEKTDREIDQMVYKLYGLTDKEIQLVEKAR